MAAEYGLLGARSCDSRRVSSRDERLFRPDRQTGGSFVNTTPKMRRPALPTPENAYPRVFGHLNTPPVQDTDLL